MGKERSKEEWVDLYNEQEEVVGRKLRSAPFPKGTHSHIVCVFTLNHQGEILLTQRHPKKSWGGLWENTAGALQVGERPVDGARRELWEETGIEASEEALIFLGTLRTTSRAHLLYAYFYCCDLPIDQIRLQEGETVNCRWAPFDLSLTTHPKLAKPVRYRLLYYWQQLASFMETTWAGTAPWLGWAKALQSYAQQGLTYSRDPFDLERFEAVRRISVDMLAYKTGLSSEKVLGLFGQEAGYQTPKVEVRAAVFHEDRVLLVLEKLNRQWSLPGGWCDIGLSLKENAEKECREEAGLAVRAELLVSLQNRSTHDYKKVLPYEIYKCYLLCHHEPHFPLDDQGIEWVPCFQENSETAQAAFFPLDQLPPLSLGRVNEKSIRLCYEAQQAPHWQSQIE